MPTLAPMEMDDDIWLAPQMMPGGGGRADSPGAMGAGNGLWGDTNMFGSGGFGEL